MLTITTPESEDFDDEKQIFITHESVTVKLEHSLAALARWESKWEKPFLGDIEKTADETLSYVLCMCLDEETDPTFLMRLSEDNIKAINAYIESKMTATTFSNLPARRTPQEKITAELIYYWMITMNIPEEYDQWHLGRLFTLIKVINAKNAPKQKISPQEAAAQQRALNKQRREQYQTKG